VRCGVVSSAGVGVESSSHKYGLFQHICRKFEVALADGSVVFCSKDTNPELFYNVPWSHGTLGFLLSAEIRIVPCKPYVHLRYIPFQSSKEALAYFEAESRKTGTEGEEAADFVEALAFSRERFVVMLGTMADRPPSADKVNAIGMWYKPWFFKHVEGYLARDQPGDEYIPLRHYYHRHSKSLFWEIQDIIPFGNHPVFRFLCGWMMPPRISLLKLTQTEALRKLYEEHHVVQDMLVPVRHLNESLDVFQEVFAVYPLWLCPMRIPQNPRFDDYGGFVRPLDDGDEMFVDIGAYGNPELENFNARKACRVVEEFVREKHGYQMMYADSYMSREEFRGMFDHRVYDVLRKKLKLCLNAFPEVYDKVCKQNRI
jgi:Delta24-sterol reductase